MHSMRSPMSATRSPRLGKPSRWALQPLVIYTTGLLLMAAAWFCWTEDSMHKYVQIMHQHGPQQHQTMDLSRVLPAATRLQVQPPPVYPLNWEYSSNLMPPGSGADQPHYLVFDAFFTESVELGGYNLYLVRTSYTLNSTEDEDLLKVGFEYGGERLLPESWNRLDRTFGSTEPVRALQLLNLHCQYNTSKPLVMQFTTHTGQWLTTTLHDVPLISSAVGSDGGIAFATLFALEQAPLVRLCHAHYTQQGVTMFYLYFNGDLKTHWDELFHAPNIQYVEWNYQYWSPSHSMETADIRPHHHAQPTFLASVNLRYSQLHDYMILADLDEFMRTPADDAAIYQHQGVQSMTLAQYVKQYPELLYKGCNTWCQLVNGSSADVDWSAWLDQQGMSVSPNTNSTQSTSDKLTAAIMSASRAQHTSVHHMDVRCETTTSTSGRSKYIYHKSFPALERAIHRPLTHYWLDDKGDCGFTMQHLVNTVPSRPREFDDNSVTPTRVFMHGRQ